MFTDVFIRRPVLAMVVSLAILVLGLRALHALPVLEYPKTENAVVTVSTVYYGADSATVAGFVTTPLENAIAQADGIDYMTSSSSNGVSAITLNLVLNYDANRALTEVSAKVNSVLNQLPPGVQQPVLTVKVGQSLDAMIIGFGSDTLTPEAITDYLTRTVQPQLQSIQGVQTAELLGARNFALRAWLDPERLASYGVTAADVSTALSSNDFIAGVGTTKGRMVQETLSASTNLHSVAEFRKLVVKQADGGIVTLGDVARVTLGADDYESSVSFDGRKGVYVGLQVVPSGNLLEVIDKAKELLPRIDAHLPAGLRSAVIYDSTDFVDGSISEVEATFVEALVIVTLVVFAFLGSLRSVVIPLVTIPLSLVGTFAMMSMFGFSLNLLTLLALVLAIGLVVDDAIIVVESVSHQVEGGATPLAASVRSARELAGPVVAMTVVLIAAYVPIGFQKGLTGALFTEFAFTLAGAVVTSAVVALTLTPMMCSRLLRPHDPRPQGWQARLVRWLDGRFARLRHRYERALRSSLDTLGVTLAFGTVVLGGVYFLYASSDKELAPVEDQGVVILSSTSSPDATLEQRLLFGRQVHDILAALPEAEHTFQIDSPSSSIAGVTLKAWDRRDRSSATLQRLLQGQLGAVAGQKIAAFQPPPLPGSQGLPVQFVLKTTLPTKQLDTFARELLTAASRSGMFLFLDSDLKLDLPQDVVDFDRDKTAQLGLTMNQVGGALGALLGGGYVNYFDLDSRSYKVIPQVMQSARLDAGQVLDYPVATVNGVPIPLSAIARIERKAMPETINHFQQVNSATLSGVAALGVSQEDAMSTLRDLAATHLPPEVQVDYAGQIRQFVEESSGFGTTFWFAVVIILLALAALFESFRDPFIILVSVPLSIAGALSFISLGVGGASLNIYTEVGLVTLMGLVSKHGILMVEVANAQRSLGRNKRDAIVAAAGVRLRPILMTTAAMVLGVAPLLVAGGAGAASRFNMGLVIATGLSIGTLFTLFVLPAVYVVAAGRRATTPHVGDERVGLQP